jgi:hypothetical protein
MEDIEGQVIRVMLGPIGDTRGHEWFTPDCPITRAFMQCKQGARKNKASYILLDDLQKFVEEGVKIEYRGRRSKLLNLLGAEKIDE